MAPADGPARGGGGPERSDIPGALQVLGDRLAEAERFLGRDRLLERRTELEKEASEPGLWDDADHAREVTTELGRVNEDIEQLAALAEQLSDAETLNELIEEEADDSLRPEVDQVLEDLDRRLGAIELRSLFAGPYDDGDAVAEIHAGAGGTDAQDWAEMMLRDVHALGRTPRLRHRGRRGHPGPGGRTPVRHLHREGPLRLRPVGRGTRGAPAGPHLALRRAASAPDQLRLARRGARSWRMSPARSRSTRRTCASTPTARRVPAASTSTRPTRPCA